MSQLQDMEVSELEDYVVRKAFEFLGINDVFLYWLINQFSGVESFCAEKDAPLAGMYNILCGIDTPCDDSFAREYFFNKVSELGIFNYRVESDQGVTWEPWKESFQLFKRRCFRLNVWYDKNGVDTASKVKHWLWDKYGDL